MKNLFFIILIYVIIQLNGQSLIPSQINEDLDAVRFSGEEAVHIDNNKLYFAYFQNEGEMTKIVFAYSEDNGVNFQFTDIDEMEFSFADMEFYEIEKPILEVLSDGRVIIAYLKMEAGIWNLYKAISDENAENFQIIMIAENVSDEIHLNQQNDILTLIYQSKDSLNFEQYSYFQYFTDTEKSVNEDGGPEAAMVKFWGPDVFEGPVHSNDDIWIQQAGGGNNGGWPTFLGPVTTAGIIWKYPTGERLLDSGAPMDQIFQGGDPGWEENVDPISLPETVGFDHNNYWAPFDGYDADIVVVKLGEGGFESMVGNIEQVGVDSIKVYSWFPDDDEAVQQIISEGGNWLEDAEYIWTNEVAVYDTIWSTGPSGVSNDRPVYVNGAELWIEGCISGEQVWACSENIYITDDVSYANTALGDSPNDENNPNRYDYFGLVSEKSIYIKYKHFDPFDNEIHSANCNDIYLYGVYAALGKGDTLIYGDQACHFDGVFSYEYQHPHGSTPDFSSISPYTGNDTVYTNIDLHKYIYPDSGNVPEGLQGFVLHGNNPPTGLPCGYPYESNEYLDSYPNNSNGDPEYSYQVPYGTDLPGNNPVGPESAADIVFERGTIYLFGSMIQRRRGYMHRSGTDPYNHQENIWDLDNFLYDGIHPSTGYEKDYHYDSRFQYHFLDGFPALDPSYNKRSLKVLTSIDEGETFSENFVYFENILPNTHRSYVSANSEKVIVALQSDGHLIILFISEDEGLTFPGFHEMENDGYYPFYFDEMYLSDYDEIYMDGTQNNFNHKVIFKYYLEPGYYTGIFNEPIDGGLTDFTLSYEEEKILAIINSDDLNSISGITAYYSLNDDLDNIQTWQIDTAGEELSIEDPKIALVFDESDSLFFILETNPVNEVGRNLYLMKASIEGISPETDDEILPVKMGLSIYPNPFNPTTTIELVNTERTRLRQGFAGQAVNTEGLKLEIYNIKGQKVKTVQINCHPEFIEGSVDSNEASSPSTTLRMTQAGSMYSISWDGRDEAGNPVGSGIYFARVKVGGQVLQKKMVLMK